MNKYDSLICRLLNTVDSAFLEDDSIVVEELIDKASHHGVLPLLHYVLSSGDRWHNCPLALQRSISNARSHAVAVSMIREQFLSSLFSALLEAGIKLILLKGEALAHTHYVSPELRVRGDTDIFVSIADIRITIQVLESDGFTVSNERSRYKSHQFTASKVILNGISLQVDVHWRISNIPAYARMFNYKMCLERSREISVSSQKCRVLQPSQGLILACVHLSVQPDEFADRLIWLYDIHLLISTMSEDELLDVAGLAAEKKVERLVFDAIKKAQVCFRTTTQHDIIASLQLTDGIRTERGGYSQSYLALIIADLHELPSLSLRWALVSELLFPGSAWLLSKYTKTSSAWVPILYMRYLVTGFFKRLILR
jgi:hypothetical protein